MAKLIYNIENATAHMWEAHKLEIQKFVSNPKDFPLYNDEWSSFVKKRTLNIVSIGGDYSSYDYSQEFKKYWADRLPQLMEVVWKKRKRYLKKLKRKRMYKTLGDLLHDVSRYASSRLYSRSILQSSSPRSSEDSDGGSEAQLKLKQFKSQFARTKNEESDDSSDGLLSSSPTCTILNSRTIRSKMSLVETLNSALENMSSSNFNKSKYSDVEIISYKEATIRKSVAMETLKSKTYSWSSLSSASHSPSPSLSRFKSSSSQSRHDICDDELERKRKNRLKTPEFSMASYHSERKSERSCSRRRSQSCRRLRRFESTHKYNRKSHSKSRERKSENSRNDSTPRSVNRHKRSRSKSGNRRRKSRSRSHSNAGLKKSKYKLLSQRISRSGSRSPFKNSRSRTSSRSESRKSRSKSRRSRSKSRRARSKSRRSRSKSRRSRSKSRRARSKSRRSRSKSRRSRSKSRRSRSKSRRSRSKSRRSRSKSRRSRSKSRKSLSKSRSSRSKSRRSRSKSRKLRLKSQLRSRRSSSRARRAPSRFRKSQSRLTRSRSRARRAQSRAGITQLKSSRGRSKSMVRSRSRSRRSRSKARRTHSRAGITQLKSSRGRSISMVRSRSRSRRSRSRARRAQSRTRKSRSKSRRASSRSMARRSQSRSLSSNSFKSVSDDKERILKPRVQEESSENFPELFIKIRNSSLKMSEENGQITLLQPVPPAEFKKEKVDILKSCEIQDPEIINSKITDEKSELNSTLNIAADQEGMLCRLPSPKENRIQSHSEECKVTSNLNIPLDEIVERMKILNKSPVKFTGNESPIPQDDNKSSDNEIIEYVKELLFLMNSIKNELGIYFHILSDIWCMFYEVSLGLKDVSYLLTIDLLVGFRKIQDKLRIECASHSTDDEKTKRKVKIIEKINDFSKYIRIPQEKLGCPTVLYGLNVFELAKSVQNLSETEAKTFINCILLYEGLTKISQAQIDQIYITALKILEINFNDDA